MESESRNEIENQTPAQAETEPSTNLTCTRKLVHWSPDLVTESSSMFFTDPIQTLLLSPCPPRLHFPSRIRWTMYGMSWVGGERKLEKPPRRLKISLETLGNTVPDNIISTNPKGAQTLCKEFSASAPQ